jgi:hypothetical protein
MRNHQRLLGLLRGGTFPEIREFYVCSYMHVDIHRITCLSDVGILGSGTTSKCLKLTAIVGQKVLCMLK